MHQSKHFCVRGQSLFKQAFHSRAC